MTTQKRNPPVCPECRSGQVNFRVKTKDFICRRCGHGWKPEMKV